MRKALPDKQSLVVTRIYPPERGVLLPERNRAKGHREVQRHYGVVCARFDVSLSGLGVLTALARQAPRALSLTEINRDILVTSGGITFVVSRLEKQGLVRRRPHPEDRRAWLISLTSRGQQVTGRLIDAIVVADEAVVTNLSLDDRLKAGHILRSVQMGIEDVMYGKVQQTCDKPNEHAP